MLGLTTRPERQVGGQLGNTYTIQFFGASQRRSRLIAEVCLIDTFFFPLLCMYLLLDDDVKLYYFVKTKRE